MPEASGIPPDEVIMHGDEMGSGAVLAVQSARASEYIARAVTHFIVHTHVDRTSDDDVELSYTYEDIRTSDWVIPPQDSSVQLSTHPGSQLSTQMWDQCLHRWNGMVLPS